MIANEDFYRLRLKAMSRELLREAFRRLRK